mmetsp:Transcript_55702/g.155238  ORF Transcript_55702/g.155238 Transcript_55702/m.155238 type:complete len:407 (-) Transcript_55702:99-1319(-)|eukprot:CAMPEP_0117514302 /NCGR_PEP_ID=MMETSP0784-20121206/29998_1 /TAXON_ID=39447 /ORGANISM="" /LENGTH=406 /DNA_ID=CAMNT_0005310091 /DNA_START=97 /DNA_END=1317 /DNA_ORIENTATION=-
MRGSEPDAAHSILAAYRSFSKTRLRKKTSSGTLLPLIAKASEKLLAKSQVEPATNEFDVGELRRIVYKRSWPNPVDDRISDVAVETPKDFGQTPQHVPTSSGNDLASMGALIAPGGVFRPRSQPEGERETVLAEQLHKDVPLDHGSGLRRRPIEGREGHPGLVHGRQLKRAQSAPHRQTGASGIFAPPLKPEQAWSTSRSDGAKGPMHGTHDVGAANGDDACEMTDMGIRGSCLELPVAIRRPKTISSQAKSRAMQKSVRNPFIDTQAREKRVLQERKWLEEDDLYMSERTEDLRHGTAMNLLVQRDTTVDDLFEKRVFYGPCSAHLRGQRRVPGKGALQGGRTPKDNAKAPGRLIQDELRRLQHDLKVSNGQQESPGRETASPGSTRLVKQELKVLFQKFGSDGV